jgi:hypothetical protein
VFAVPYLLDDDPPTMIHRFEAWKAILNTLDVDFLAWAFPGVGWKMKWKGRVYPGVALLGKEAAK